MSRKSGQEYPQELRDQVLAATGTVREIARRLGVSAAYVSKVKSRMRQAGERATRPRGGRRPLILAGYEDLLRQRLADTPHATLAELRAWLAETHGIRISSGGLWNSVKRMGLTLRRAHRGRRGGEGKAPSETEPGVTPDPALAVSKFAPIGEPCHRAAEMSVKVR